MLHKLCFGCNKEFTYKNGIGQGRRKYCTDICRNRYYARLYSHKAKERILNRRKKRAKVHGWPKKTSEEIAYGNARARCVNPQNRGYRNYGARGIEFKFKNFKEFIKHIGPKPPGKSLERIDNNGNYEIGNVKWSSKLEQMSNTRWNVKYRISVLERLKTLAESCSHCREELKLIIRSL